MRVVTARISAAMLFLLFATALFAQQTPTVTETAIPRLVRITSVFVPANGLPAAPVEIVTFAIYADERGGSPLWQETQNVTVNTDGRYTVLLGATQTDGLPQDLFTTGEARWLGRRFERTGEPEQARVLLASVPYALKAADADMLGGKPLAAFVLADGTAAGGGAPPIRTATPGNTVPTVSGAVSGTGTINQLTKWVDTAGTLVDSAIAEAGGNVGIGTMTPNGQLHIFGSVNTDIFAGMGPNLISGPAFNFGYGGNSLGRSVGFFNVRPDALAVAPNPSLRFFTANVERMIVANTGDVGIGTSMPYTGVNNVSGRLSLAAPSTDENTLFVRKPPSTFDFAIQARSDLGVNGPTIGGVAGYADGVGIAPTQSVGVFGAQANSNGNAIQAYNATSTGAAMFASGGQFAGDFSGNVRVTGNLTVTGSVSKGSGSFKIDHPLDPANKYLSHSFVESPDMMNIYNGNVTLDANGEAIVMLQGWFEALNRDFRYQLTALGAPGPNLYIAEEIANGRFKIGGGAGGGRVSWQVTGIRHDAFAEAHRIAIEEDKPATERDHYLYPELYGQPADTRIGPETKVMKKVQ